MAYEKIAIVESTPALPSQPSSQVREDRVVDPYKSNNRIAKAMAQASATQASAPKPTNGQVDINSDLSEGDEETKPAEETVTLSPQMAALARKEQKFRQQEQELKKRVQSLEAEKAEIAELKALKAKLEAKDFSAIEGLVKYDDYTNYLIEKDTALTPAEQAVKKLSEEVEALKSSQKDDVTKRFEAAVNERRKAVTQIVESNPDFSSIKELKAEEAVVQHILSTWEHDNVDLSPEEAAKEVEELLVEKANRWSSLSKLKAKSETTPPVEPEDKKTLPQLKSSIKTLTNNMAATGEIKRPVKSFQHMSDSERYAEARRRAEEKLKQRT